MQDRDWLFPSLALTALIGAVALVFMPEWSGLLPALRILPGWMGATTLIAIFCGYAWLRWTGEAQPIPAMHAYARREWRKTLLVALVMSVAGMNMIAFMWIKPLLNYLIPFWADPVLADIDRAIFLGHDPWTLLAWMNGPASGMIYHPVWCVMMIFALLMAASAPPSAEKSAVLLSYFALWSLVGPIVHILLPAAGPVFYERMGYGPRYAGLDGGPETKAVADYLWAIYSTRSFGAGSGISAMPSLHVTIATWTVIAFHTFARRWRVAALVSWLVIFLLSISLGWHYAGDGIVGTIAALFVYFGLLKLFRARSPFTPGRAPFRPQPLLARAAR